MPYGTKTRGERTAYDRYLRIDPPATPTVCEVTAEANGITARYTTTDRERHLRIERSGTAVTIAQNRDGYGMLKVCEDGTELERYYGFDMALDHAAERVGVDPKVVPIPEAATDMGM